MPSPEETAKQLVEEGWMQTSSKYRMIARIPEGMTAFQALRAASPDEYAHLMTQFERRAADIFRRLNNQSKFPECYRELDQETFLAFRKAGGESSF